MRSEFGNKIPRGLKQATSQCAEHYWEDDYDFVFSGKRYEKYFEIPATGMQLSLFPKRPRSYEEKNWEERDNPKWNRPYLRDDGTMIKDD